MINVIKPPIISKQANNNATVCPSILFSAFIVVCLMFTQRYTNIIHIPNYFTTILHQKICYTATF